MIEKTPVSPSSRQRVAIETTRRFDRAHVVERETAVDDGAHALLERDLVVGELEVHPVQRSFGRPSTRSPTMFLFTCDVPAAMVIESA